VMDTYRVMVVCAILKKLLVGPVKLEHPPRLTKVSCFSKLRAMVQDSRAANKVETISFESVQSC
jgi:hypothetical protein